MGSSNSSKCTVPNLGEYDTKKKMILNNHQNCILKTKFKEIKEKYGNKYENKEIDNNDKWFINFIKINYLDDSYTEKEIIKYITTKNVDLNKYSEYLDNEYDNIPDSEKSKMLSKFHLSVCWWYYQRVGSHRVLQLIFHCKECGSSKTIEMDKSTSGKNIDYANNSYNAPQWWHWRKYPKYTYDFNDILRYYHRASNEYNWAKNNCSHFAHEIYDNIIGKQTY